MTADSTAAELAQLLTAIAALDPEDLDRAGELASEHARLAHLIAADADRAVLYGAGQALTEKLRLARAKFTQRKAELFETSFLLRALAADLPGRAQPGERVDLLA